MKIAKLLPTNMSITRRHLVQSALATCTGTVLPTRDDKLRILIGYGVVNRWHTIDAAAFANVLRQAECNFTEIEYLAWFNSKGREGKSTETRIEAARTFVNEMRRHRITTMISVVNWNGEAQRAASNDWYLDRLREISKRIGTKDILLLPVSEPDGQQSGKAHRWTEMARHEWKGLLVGNGDGGRGDPRVTGFDYVDWHHCEDFNAESVRNITADKPTINNTDCGPVLNPGPERARKMARIALQRSTNLLIYGWEDDRFDESVISALGQEIKRDRKMRHARHYSTVNT
jgi:hypothetical protein